MARFIFFLALFSTVYQSTIANTMEKANIDFESKYGARNLINIAKPMDASEAFHIISCTAKKPTGHFTEKTLSEMTQLRNTSGHFISSKHNCSFELTTTGEYGKWYILTEYYAKDNVTKLIQKDIVNVKPSSSGIIGTSPAFVKTRVDATFEIPKNHQLEKVEMIKLSDENDADLKYHIYPINHHSSIFENVACTRDRCNCIFREWRENYYGKWKIRAVFKDQRTPHQFLQQFRQLNFQRPELEGPRNETQEAVISAWSKKMRTDVFHVSVGGRVRVNIDSPKKGKIVKCSVVHTEKNQMHFEKKDSDRSDDYIDFYNYGDCSFIMKNFAEDMYGKWQVITIYEYNPDRYRTLQTEKTDTIYFDDEDEPAEVRFVAPDFEFTVLPVIPEKIMTVNVGEKLLLWPNNNTAGHVHRCEAVHVGEYEDIIYEIQPNRDSRLLYDYNGLFTNCNFTFSPFQDKHYGKWIVSSYYTYPKNSTNRVREDALFRIEPKRELSP